MGKQDMYTHHSQLNMHHIQRGQQEYVEIFRGLKKDDRFHMENKDLKTISRNFSINPGRWGLFLEVRITHDGCGYVHQTGISSNVTADKGNFERKKRFVGPWKRIAVQAAVYFGMTHKYADFQKQAPTVPIDPNLLRSYA